MVDGAREEERQPVSIGPPHQRPYVKRLPLWRDEPEVNPGAGPKPDLRDDLRPARTDVHRLTRMALFPHFNEHRPGHAPSRVLSALPSLIDRTHSIT